MNNNKRLSFATRCWHSGVLLILAISFPLSHAATVWNGPTVKFTQSAGTPSDVVLAGKVVLTRGGNQVLFNTAAGEASWGADSPLDTEWALGTLAGFSTNHYQSLESMRNTDLAGIILNTPMVMHIKNEDIYLSVMFTAWGQHAAGGWSYTRSTPAATSPPVPTVTITVPAAGSTFTAPASINLLSSAAVSSGVVTNVEYFAGATSLGKATTAPFHVTGNISDPGAYDLTAVATAAGVSGTSAVVHVTVVATPTVSITSPAEGTVFALPESVTITGDASVSGGTVTNIALFANTILLGAVDSSPFMFTTTNLGPGDYALTAVATASGISVTSAVVNIRVVLPVTVSLSAPVVSGDLFSFNFNADAGVSYVVQTSSNLLDWTSVATNLATSNPIPFSENLDTNVPHFYRVERLTGP